MKAHRAHPQWTGRLNQRQGKGFSRPETDWSYTLARGGDHVGDRYDADELDLLLRGARIFHRLVTYLRAEMPSLADWEARERAHAALRGRYELEEAKACRQAYLRHRDDMRSCWIERQGGDWVEVPWWLRDPEAT